SGVIRKFRCDDRGFPASDLCDISGRRSYAPLVELTIDFNFAMQRPMYRTFVGDLQQPGPLLPVERPGKLDLSADAVDPAFARRAVGTVLGVNLGVVQGDAGMLE